MHLEFKFPAENSEFFRFKCLNFPPKNLDVIVGVVGVVVVVGHGDNRGTSFNWHFSVKPKIENRYKYFVAKILIQPGFWPTD